MAIIPIFKLGGWWLKINTVEQQTKHFDDSIIDLIINTMLLWIILIMIKLYALTALNQFRTVNNIATSPPKKGRPKSQPRPKSFIEKSNN